MNFITKLSQYIVGFLFIFSGLIKANDPLGFSYKLQEYFEEFSKYDPISEVFHFCNEIALPLAVFLVIVEVVLGIALIARYRPKFTISMLFGLIVFFTILTFSSAYFGIVRSCGCFGDAIPLSPWQSFYKDIVLLILICILMIEAFRNTLSNLKIDKTDLLFAILGIVFLGFISFQLDWLFIVLFTALLIALNMLNRNYPGYIVFIGFLLISLFTLFSYLYLPDKDFRAYAKGKSIIDGMKTANELGLQPTEYANIYIMRDSLTGEKYEIYSSDYLQKVQDNPNLIFVEALDKTVVIQKGYEPSIIDFSIEFEGKNWTESILQEKFVLLVVIYDIYATQVSVQNNINILADSLESLGIKTIGLSASSYEMIDQFRHDYQIMYPYYYMDDIPLKTMVRSNPGLVLLKNGVVSGKWPWRKIPTFKTMHNIYLSE